MMAGPRCRDERGSVAPVFLAALFLLVGVIGISCDLSGAWLVHTARANDLAAARDQVCAAPTALVIKNADDPGLETARQVARALRENGFEGAARVWFYEAPAGDVPDGKGDSKRVLAWTAQVTQDYAPPFSSGFGFDGIAVTADVTSSSIAYSGGRTWRPESDGPVGCGLYTFEPGSAEPAYSAVGDGGYPSALAGAVEERLAQIDAETT